MKRLHLLGIYVGSTLLFFGIQVPGFPAWDMLASALVALVFSLASSGAILMAVILWRSKTE